MAKNKPTYEDNRKSSVGGYSILLLLIPLLFAAASERLPMTTSCIYVLAITVVFCIVGKVVDGIRRNSVRKNRQRQNEQEKKELRKKIDRLRIREAELSDSCSTCGKSCSCRNEKSADGHRLR